MEHLARLCEEFCANDGVFPTGIPGVTLYRIEDESLPACSIQEPALAVVVRGSKKVILADTVYTYDPAHFLLVSIDLPTVSYPVEFPYIGLKVVLKPALVLEVMAQAGVQPTVPSGGLGLAVSPLDRNLTDALVRLIQLVGRPGDTTVLAPLIQREIVYHLLCGPQRDQLLRIATGDQGRGVVQAVRWLRHNYAEPMRVEELARELNMSSSGLHHQFKALTSMSPLQYQKQLRLQEARRLLLNEEADAASVSYRVGYNSPSQFSREYRRFFGHPPGRDIARLRGVAVDAV